MTRTASNRRTPDRHTPRRVAQHRGACRCRYVSAWAGGVEIEPTAIYGMRVYGPSALLYSHVDKEHTHALSLIMNVDQVRGAAAC